MCKKCKECGEEMIMKNGFYKCENTKWCDNNKLNNESIKELTGETNQEYNNRIKGDEVKK